MNSSPKPARHGRGLTLLEILIVMVIVAVVAAIAFTVGSRTIEKAKWVSDVSKMRLINNSILARATENNDIAYTKEETGNSVYREWEDPMSLCQILREYMEANGGWLSPSASARHKKFKNSYAWSQAAVISYDPVKNIRLSSENPRSVLTIWNNFGYTLPSGFNRPEANKVGPTQAPKNFHQKPWNYKKEANYFYLDGHVETR